MEASAWPITFRVGAATFRVPLGSFDVMSRVIDELMYEAKGSGKAGIKLLPDAERLGSAGPASEPAIP